MMDMTHATIHNALIQVCCDLLLVQVLCLLMTCATPVRLNQKAMLDHPSYYDNHLLLEIIIVIMQQYQLEQLS